MNNILFTEAFCQLLWDVIVQAIVSIFTGQPSMKTGYLFHILSSSRPTRSLRLDLGKKKQGDQVITDWPLIPKHVRYQIVALAEWELVLLYIENNGPRPESGRSSNDAAKPSLQELLVSVSLVTRKGPTGSFPMILNPNMTPPSLC